ncbi:MAG TPA: lysylphosphatidylglycerol synthase transmembrane domain-containing protein [Methanoregulaceae archaeon]|nr:lysylphosphatidylglycerol synthase transmembrane domain-containing protein [Methanoregulaceae archaeon]
MWKKLSAIIIPTIIAAGIIAYMLLSVWDQLLVALQHFVPIYLVPAVLVCFLAWVLRGVRYKGILETLEVKASLAVATACIFISQTANIIVPARLGDLVRIFILNHEYDTPMSTGISSLVVERVFDIVMVALLGVITIPFVVNVPQWLILLVVVPLGIIAALFLVLIAFGKIRTENHYVLLLLTMLEEIRKASLNVRSLLQFSFVSMIIWLLDITVCVFVVLMFDQQVILPVVILAIVVGNLVKAVPVTPGGIGTYEAAVGITFQLSGMEPALAYIIAVTDHLIKNLATAAGGVISIYYFGDWVISILKSAFNKELKV